MKVLVVGGGAAGLMAAISAAECGAAVEVVERNNCLGKKLSITGKGRCNLTNDCTIEEVIRNFPDQGNFLYSSLFAFPPQDVKEFFQGLGVKLKVERGHRVFPFSDRAEEIVQALTDYAQRLGVKVHYNCRVNQLLLKENAVCGSDCGKRRLKADAVIIATGGQSYPKTGSTGDGFILAQDAGHTIAPIYPALVPLETAEKWSWELSGLTLKNVMVSVFCDGKLLAKEFGEMLFTHFGVSGPVILTLSQTVCRHLQKGQITLRIDLKPALSTEQLQVRVQRDLNKYAKKHFQNTLTDLLPASLIPVIVKLSTIDPYKKGNQISKKERDQLVNILKGLVVSVTKARPLSEAIVTSGGVSLKEIDPKTMGSRLVKGLYFAGEVLDLAGFTGGFNLQAAWSTGRAAGRAAAE